MSTFSQADGVYLSNNDLIAIEVEDAAPVGGWKFETQYAGYTGGGYYRYVGDQTITDKGQDVLAYNVNLETTGTYFLTLHTFRNGTAEGRKVTGDQENDLWIRINGGKWTKMVFYSEEGEWGWASNMSQNHTISPASFELTEGANVIELSGRSSNVMVNRIHLAKDRPNRNASSTLSPISDEPVDPLPRTISGSFRDDMLVGLDGADLIEGKGGNDELKGLAGDDILDGGAGSDLLEGGDGNDALNGGRGDDILIGSSGGVNTAPEIDALAGGAGADTFVLGSASLGTLYAKAGDSDYALIQDFRRRQGDVIALEGPVDGFTVQRNFEFNGTTTNTAIFLGTDLIAIAQGASLRSFDFIVGEA